MEQENRALAQKMDGSNNYVGSFMREMSTLLDSHMIPNITQGRHHGYGDSDLDDEEMNLEVDYDENRPHAGTGGSSKMRSRPN